MRFVIVTGMSGAGKSTALKMLEDAEYFCVDNLPIPLVEKFAQLTADGTSGEIQKVAMKDDTAKGKVILNKTDKSSGEPLKGVEFELRDSKGKVMETLKTDAAGHAESKLYEIATFKNGKYDTAIKYYLVETKTLDGYTLDQTKHEVTFTYVDDKTPVIEVIQKVTNEKLPEDTPSVSNPKTGDDTNLWIPALCLILSAGGLIGMGVASRRKKKKGGR